MPPSTKGPQSSKQWVFVVLVIIAGSLGLMVMQLSSTVEGDGDLLSHWGPPGDLGLPLRRGTVICLECAYMQYAQTEYMYYMCGRCCTSTS